MLWYFIKSPPPADWPFYCPQNIAGFDDINFVVTPSYTNVNYCPQNIAGFDDINFVVTPSYTNVNYCPQDITGFDSFTQAP